METIDYILIIIAAVLCVSLLISFIYLLRMGNSSGKKSHNGELGASSAACTQYQWQPERRTGEEHLKPYSMLEGGKDNQMVRSWKSMADDDPQTVGIVAGRARMDSYVDDGATELLSGSASAAYNLSARVKLRYNHNGSDRTVEMNKATLSIGRDESNDIALGFDKFIGRNHALLVNKNGELFLTDLDSKNGTSIGSERIKGTIRIDRTTDVKFASTMIRIILD